MQRQNDAAATATEVEDFAFNHLAGLASLLHADGSRDLAVLLDGMGDMRDLARRRARQGGSKALLASSGDTLDYVLDQLADLARLMEDSGRPDVALLFALPARLAAAAEDRVPSAQGAASIHFIRPPLSAAPQTAAAPFVIADQSKMRNAV